MQPALPIGRVLLSPLFFVPFNMCPSALRMLSGGPKREEFIQLRSIFFFAEKTSAEAICANNYRELSKIAFVWQHTLASMMAVLCTLNRSGEV